MERRQGPPMTLQAHGNNKPDPSPGPSTVAVDTLLILLLPARPGLVAGEDESAAVPGTQPADHRHTQLHPLRTSLAVLPWVPPPVE